MFSIIELKSDYYLFRIREENIPKTIFRTRYGNHEFLVMFFRLTYALDAFMGLMKRVLRPYLYLFKTLSTNDIYYSHSEGLIMRSISRLWSILLGINRFMLSQSVCS